MLENLFNSQVKAVILTRLFTPERRKYHLRQLARDGGISAPGLLKELNHFHELRLVIKKENSTNTDYYADPMSPLFPILCELVDKAEGLAGKIRRMLSPLDTDCIFIFGSEANGTAMPGSDIDLFVIGSCTLVDISRALLPASDITNREINTTLYSADEFRRKCHMKDHFVQSVMDAPMFFLKGGKNELKRLAG